MKWTIRIILLIALWFIPFAYMIDEGGMIATIGAGLMFFITLPYTGVFIMWVREEEY